MFGGKSLNFIVYDSKGRARIGLANQVVRGKEYLVNLILYYLFTEQGSNIFDKQAGTLFGSIPTADIELWVAQSIENVKDKIFQLQSENENLDPDEKLRDLTLEEIKYVPEEEAVEITLNVITESGEQILLST